MTLVMVLIAEMPSQPCLKAVPAGCLMSVTLGVILAHTGMVALLLIQPHTSCSTTHWLSWRVWALHPSPHQQEVVLKPFVEAVISRMPSKPVWGLVHRNRDLLSRHLCTYLQNPPSLHTRACARMHAHARGGEARRGGARIKESNTHVKCLCVCSRDFPAGEGRKSTIPKLVIRAIKRKSYSRAT